MKQWWWFFVLLIPSVAALTTRPASQRSSSGWSRRELCWAGAASLCLPRTANAADTPAAAVVPAVKDLLARVNAIPTFCIVNAETGGSYMMFQKSERMAKGYAFTTFEGALTVLGDAQRAAEEGGYADTWKNATITTIPADIAIRLALQKRERKSQKDQTLDTIVAVIPGVEDREIAMVIDKKFSDQGKVPLFYFDGLTTTDENSAPATPVYLHKKDLLDAWEKQYGGVRPPPKLQALELVETFQNALLGRPVKNIVFVPPPDTMEVVKELKSRGKLAPYKADKMVI